MYAIRDSIYSIVLTLARGSRDGHWSKVLWPDPRSTPQSKWPNRTHLINQQFFLRIQPYPNH